MTQHKKLTILLICCLFIVSNLLLNFHKVKIEGILPLDEENPVVVQNKGDLQIEFVTNQSSIGKDNGALGTLTLTNNGVNPVGNIAIDFGLEGNYAFLTQTYAHHQESTLINPGYGEDFQIEVVVNKTEFTEEVGFNAVDLCLVFDCSGSMGSEIDSVKNAFINIVNNLTTEIESLRIGMIVYGWSKYSEYPQENSNNYLPFTDDYDAVNSFIQSLYASGSIEPWGDALYLANSWDWRENAQKLLIIVGDEDCDPGHIIGAGHSGNYYNGSQLVEVVNNLKEKDVTINSVRTDDEAIFVNQFTWIAEYTNGVSVDLEELEQREPPITLPDLIETWTLSLTREYYLYLYANISWTEYTGGGDVNYNEQVGVDLLLDVAPPYISLSALIQADSSNSFTLQAFGIIKDPSGISSAAIYWTFDDLNAVTEPFWHFEMLTNVSKDTYMKSFSGLALGQNVSFYFIAFDNVNNRGESEIYNCTIQITKAKFASTTIVLFPKDNTKVSLFFSLEDRSQGFLNIRNFTGSLSLAENSNFTLTTVLATKQNMVVKITKSGSENFVCVNLNGNISSVPTTIFWNYDYYLSEELLNDYQDTFHSKRTNILLRVSIVHPNQLCLVRIDTELVALIDVYTENWEFIGQASARKALTLSEGVYYLWVYNVLREGSFKLYFGDNPPLETDSYLQAPIPLPVIVLLLALALSSFHLFRKKRNKDRVR